MQLKKQETEKTNENWAFCPAGGVKVTTQDAKVHFQVLRWISRCLCKGLQLCLRHFLFNDVLFEMLFETTFNMHAKKKVSCAIDQYCLHVSAFSKSFEPAVKI